MHKDRVNEAHKLFEFESSDFRFTIPLEYEMTPCEVKIQIQILGMLLSGIGNNSL